VVSVLDLRGRVRRQAGRMFEAAAQIVSVLAVEFLRTCPSWLLTRTHAGGTPAGSCPPVVPTGNSSRCVFACVKIERWWPAEWIARGVPSAKSVSVCLCVVVWFPLSVLPRQVRCSEPKLVTAHEPPKRDWTGPVYFTRGGPVGRRWPRADEIAVDEAARPSTGSRYR